MSEVYVYIYDISKGLAKQLSLSLLGKYIPGIWHTGIVAYGQEIFFGSGGIDFCAPTGTLLGEPDERVKLGDTLKNKEELNLHLSNLSHTIFHGSKYDLLDHNCNTFSNELSIWLTGRGIPEYITNLPREILSTPFGQTIKPLIDQYSPNISKTAASHSKYADYSSNLSVVYYKDSLGLHEAFFSGKIAIPQPVYMEILTSMVSSINEHTPSYIRDEIIDLIVLTENKDSMDINAKIAIFDILRLFILKDIENVVSLFVDPLVWMKPVLKESSDENLSNSKCKFLCNLIGKHFDIISTNKEILSIISNFGLLCLQNKLTIEVASSLIRNLVVNVSELGEDIMLDISSSLVHILSNEEMSLNEITKENIIGSIYYLVKHSNFVKDLAKAQDIDKRIRRETIYCQLLYKALQ